MQLLQINVQRLKHEDPNNEISLQLGTSVADGILCKTQLTRREAPHPLPRKRRVVVPEMTLQQH